MTNRDKLIKNAIDMGYELDDALDMDIDKLEGLWLVKNIQTLRKKLERVNERSLWGIYVNNEFLKDVPIHDLGEDIIREYFESRYTPDKYNVKILYEDKIILIFRNESNST